MNCADILDAWAVDVVIDETDLVTESLKIPKLHSKYLGWFSYARLKLKSLQHKRKTLTSTLREYYAGDLNHPDSLKEISRPPWARKVLKQDMHYYIDADKEMVVLNLKIATQEEIVLVLEEILKALNTRNFLIKSSIDFMRLTMGG